jgi:hypothetical protein
MLAFETGQPRDRVADAAEFVAEDGQPVVDPWTTMFAAPGGRWPATVVKLPCTRAVEVDQLVIAHAPTKSCDVTRSLAGSTQGGWGSQPSMVAGFDPSGSIHWVGALLVQTRSKRPKQAAWPVPTKVSTQQAGPVTRPLRSCNGPPELPPARRAGVPMHAPRFALRGRAVVVEGGLLRAAARVAHGAGAVLVA